MPLINALFVFVIHVFIPNFLFDYGYFDSKI
jgi:hypothetical protein